LFIEAADANGTAWSEPQIVAFTRFDPGLSQAAVLDGKLIVAFYDGFFRDPDRFFVDNVFSLREL
jgi:hypothetical protein